MKIFLVILGLVTFEAQAYCRLSYKGPKLSPGGTCFEQVKTYDECLSIAQNTFSSDQYHTTFRYSKSKQAAVFVTWQTGYSSVEMLYEGSGQQVTKTFKRKRSEVAPKIIAKWSRSCDVRSCLAHPDPDSCWHECDVARELENAPKQ